MAKIMRAPKGMLVRNENGPDSESSMMRGRKMGEMGRMESMSEDDDSGHSPLDQAIELHEEHMKNPSTATPESQQELMDLLLAHRQMMSGMGEDQ